ncbi:3-hydroxy-3-methylglutaryl-coenzyme A reductase [uncultured archaeon]|nr:3-hydroxy-3-methylglutaryl-coenzyme A reductase [uncultured archaeon]
MANSRLSGFYKLPPHERLSLVVKECALTKEESDSLSGIGLSVSQADRMIENVVGLYSLPVGIATNFLINGRDYIVPMVVEEPSVVAAASNSARIAREGGGFKAETTDPVMIGQIQVIGLVDAKEAAEIVLSHKQEIVDFCNQQDSILVKFGGGCRDVEARVIDTKGGKMLIVHILVDVRDAMGANAINTMAERVAPKIEEWTGGKVLLRIISNLAVYRLARSKAVFPAKELGGEEVVDAILNAYWFAEADPFRGATHNKGIMNGISAVTVATGNDWRAVEAGAHSYASFKHHRYTTLSHYEKDKNGDLVGTIELPLAVGLVGGATKIHPTARANVRILGVKSAAELSQVIASVGLAQNLAALRALATEGIQKGHMRLHARNVAATAGAEGDDVEEVARLIYEAKKVNVEYAKEVLANLKK